MCSKAKNWSKFILTIIQGWKCISNILKRVILSRHFIRLIKLFYTLDFLLKSNIKYEIWILFHQNSKHAPIRTGHYSNWISMIFPPIFTIICLAYPFLVEHVWWNSNLIDVFIAQIFLCILKWKFYFFHEIFQWFTIPYTYGNLWYDMKIPPLFDDQP